MSDYLNKEKLGALFQKHAGSATNTGSTEGQIALFTYRISHMSNHLKANPKDHDTRRSLIKMVGRRKDLLKYLAKKDLNKYRSLIAELGIRDTKR
jgi:small subunit ribosomal protein S15